MIKHIFFDLDGTLVDSMPGIEYSARRAVAQAYPGRSLQNLRPFIGPPIREMLRVAIPEEDVNILNECESSFRIHYDQDGWRHTECYPGVETCLESLFNEGFKCHVLTNKPYIPTGKIVSQLGLAEYLCELISPDTKNPRYASKVEAALDAQKRLQLTPDQGIVVGDSLDDAMAAAACGFKFAAVCFGYGTAHSDSNATVHFRMDSFADILPIVGATHV